MSVKTGTTSDQRAFARRNIDQPITFTLFNTRQRLLEHQCRTRNQSDTGICFESTQPLHPGAVLFIRAGKNAVSQADLEVLSRDTAVAEVRWCKPNTRKDEQFYKIGVRFY